MNRHIILSGIIFLVVFTALGEVEPPKNLQKGPVAPWNRDVSTADIDVQNRVHRAGAMWMNITNWGFFGNTSTRNTNQMDDPEYPGTWAPQCEFPGGSGVQYLYQGALWLGAMIQDEGFQYPRVSTGTEGWVLVGNNQRVNEFYPGEVPSPIVERSTRPNAFNRLGDFVSSDLAISEQDFIATYTDTLTEPFYVAADPLDGPHNPLGIKIIQTSYSWSYAYARDFIIIDWEIENIAENYLKNLFVGLYVDADVGHIDEQTGGADAGHTDDICGFQKFYYYENANGELDSSVINTAWISDNDGRRAPISAGNDFTTPHVTGTRVVRAPNPRLKTSFNWWISNTDDDLDYGPAWEDDESEGDWTGILGTPLGDARKYFVLSNREFDYDQVYVDDPDWIGENDQLSVNPATGEEETHNWRIEDSPVLADLANGYDTRYLLSWGPLGIFDFIDDAGERIYRLNPGERFSMTVGYVAGENFHDRNNQQPTNATIDPELFDFSDLRYNADWVAKVYDNPMIDTNDDGWYGEDTGIDELYAEEIGAPVVIDGLVVGTYPGPDDGERDNHLQEEEDLNSFRPERYNYMAGNGMLDLGDGEPDFRGPPPPPIPELEHSPHYNDIRLTWRKFPSEDPDYRDPFSRLQDFEGYRIYTSTTGLEGEYNFLDEFDRIDYAYFTENDSLVTEPVEDIGGMDDIIIVDDLTLYLKEVGPNTGFDRIWDPVSQEYLYKLPDTHPLIPRWYAVTVYDYGDPKSGTPPLESSKGANAIYIAPSGDPSKKPGVVPNPYRADQDYTLIHGDGGQWENRDDGTVSYFPQIDRRIYFYNLPARCIIRVFTVSGDLVQIIPHEVSGDHNSLERMEFAESWDLNSRNQQQIVSGLYLFSVEDQSEVNKGEIQSGKFVVIR
ncbi:MAG: hypothetical protein P9L92_13655 [Candidatus Electryonea clarkiae]|nr:hypothetical protein [Candidatus Electryonea clarkiae]MDP8289214.1 hypothetical protein [Candidatus Electryonea clarkiae]